MSDEPKTVTTPIIEEVKDPKQEVKNTLSVVDNRTGKSYDL